MANIQQNNKRIILNSKILILQQRIDAFVKLGSFLASEEAAESPILHAVSTKNPWYTRANVLQQFQAIAGNLTAAKLEQWLANAPQQDVPKTVGLVLAGNLPLVGFHDIMTVLLAGFTAMIKTSSDDAGLTNFVLDKLLDLEPQFREKIKLVERLDNFDLVIATGSNNSARYFEHYFGKYPHIIRKNRNSLAVLSGQETPEQLTALGHDIFDYFGLGCRSVSKIFLPKAYPIPQLFDQLESFHPIKDHFKYNNNYDFNKSIYLINKNVHFDNGFLLLKEDDALASPLAVVHYAYYENIQDVKEYINTHNEEIQCVTTEMDLQGVESPVFPLGNSQCPALDDYADNVDTLAFLVANQ